jgi:exonuclease SbcC
VQEWDSKIRQYKSDYDKAQEERQAQTIKIQEIDAEKQAIARAIKSVEDNSRTAQNYLAEHNADKDLLAEFPLLQEQMRSIFDEENKKEAMHKRVQSAQDAMEAVRAEKETQKQNVEAVEDKKKSLLFKISSQSETLQKLLKGQSEEYYTERYQHLIEKQQLHDRIAVLEEERVKLEAGVPCVVCGSLEHPVLDSIANEAGEKEERGSLSVREELAQEIELLKSLLDEISTQKQFLDKAKAELEVVHSQLEGAQKLVEQAQKSCLEKEASYSQAEQDEKIFLTELTAKKTALLAKLQKYFAENLAGENLGQESLVKLGGELKTRSENWQKYIEDQEQVEEKLREYSDQEKVLDTQRQNLLENQKQAQKRVNEAEGLQTEAAEKRHTLFGKKDLGAERKAMQERLAQADKKREHMQQVFQQAQQAAEKVRTEKSRLEAELQKLEADVRIWQDAFAQALSDSSFTSEKDFREALLPLVELQTLREQKQKLATRLSTAQKLREEASQEWQKLAEQNLCTQSTAELDEQLRSISDELNERLRELGAYRQKLEQQQKAKENLASKQKALQESKENEANWKNLNDLIGSAKGHKFRNIAQSMTFEIMVAHANLQLQKMSDRYLLIQDEKNPLELNVIDQYQAGEIRSTQNISGGESFILSLSLALGLSEMASDKVQIDSLFLDEGFGTLDEDTLDVALSALAGLNKEGKMIGIISHVSALKERINTQIEVRASSSSGRSILKGPGVKNGFTNGFFQ